MELKRKEIRDRVFTYFTRHDHSSLDNFIDRIKSNINRRKIANDLYNEIVNAWINIDTVEDFNEWFDERWSQFNKNDRIRLYENVSFFMIANGFGYPTSIRADCEEFDSGYTPAKAMGDENYKEYSYLTEYLKNDKRANDAFEAELNRHHDEISALHDDVEGTYFMIECLFEEFKKEIENSTRTAKEKELALNDLIVKIKSPAKKWKDEYFNEFELIYEGKKHTDLKNKLIALYAGKFTRFDTLQFSFVVLCHVYKNDNYFLSLLPDKLNIEDLSIEDKCIELFINNRNTRNWRKKNKNGGVN